LAKNKQKAPALSSFAALSTLAFALWMEVDLPVALFRAVIVYLVLSLLTMAFKVVIARLVTTSQQKSEQELLVKIQREAEEEAVRQAEQRKKRDEEHKRQMETRAKREANRQAPPPVGNTKTKGNDAPADK